MVDLLFWAFVVVFVAPVAVMLVAIPCITAITVVEIRAGAESKRLARGEEAPSESADPA